MPKNRQTPLATKIAQTILIIRQQKTVGRNGALKIKTKNYANYNIENNNWQKNICWYPSNILFFAKNSIDTNSHNLDYLSNDSAIA
ncbi:MAG: hypothetical protein HC778_01795 [Chamaesiphon sp. CSU_1_12]|nr:hypothetical protein [Chamaesiphon sp. CSU_1_12]